MWKAFHSSVRALALHGWEMLSLLVLRGAWVVFDTDRSCVPSTSGSCRGEKVWVTGAWCGTKEARECEFRTLLWVEYSVSITIALSPCFSADSSLVAGLAEERRGISAGMHHASVWAHHP